jgi:hypothetical protein
MTSILRLNVNFITVTIFELFKFDGGGRDLSAKDCPKGVDRRWYVVAAAAVALLFLTSHVISFMIENVNETVPGDAVRPLLFGLLASASLVLSLIFGRHAKKISLLGATFFYVVFYFSLLQYSSPTGFLYGLTQEYLGVTVRHGVLGLVVLIVLTIVPFLLFLRLGLDRSLLLVGTFAVGSAGTALVNYTMSHAVVGDEDVSLQPPPVDLAAAKPPFPDIFYIVPDRYGSVSALRHLFDFDNGPFVEELRRRGFYVADEAFANYPQTSWSLASSLNMAFLDHLTEKYGRNSANQFPLFRLIENNSVQSILRQLGYRYVHTASQWRGTLWNAHADVNFSAVSRTERVLGLTEVEIMLMNMTPLGAIVRRIDHGAYPGCERVRGQIDFIKNEGGRSQPTFLFAHLMMPHEPIFLDENAQCIEPTSYERLHWRDFGRAFIGYLKFGNAALLDIIDHQLRNNPNGMIFIIQADEGPYPPSLREKRDSYTSLSAPDLAAKLGILNAIYIPGSDYRRFHSSLSPINNWRLVLSHLLRRDLQLAEDRSYVFTDERHIFEFRDVTDRLRRIQSGERRTR